jgi:hypothetical protein
MDIKNAVDKCGHCIIGNNADHSAQKVLNVVSMDKPFDIILMDIWHPGRTHKDNSMEKTDLT